MGEMKERMLRGDPYIAEDEDLAGDFGRAQAILEIYNRSAFADQELRDGLLHELLAECGDGVHIRPPFHLEYGTRVSIGARTFFNYDCLMLDVAPVTIGADCQVATRVQFITATHPIDPEPRRNGWESAKPIVVGDNVWLSAGVIVCPGVTIGNDTVVGAGAVVTRDLSAGVVAMGVPARVVREIGEQDRIQIPRNRTGSRGKRRQRAVAVVSQRHILASRCSHVYSLRRSARRGSALARKAPPGPTPPWSPPTSR